MTKNNKFYLTSISILLGLTILISSCSSNTLNKSGKGVSFEEEARKTANQFMTSLKASDYDLYCEYTTQEYRDSETELDSFFDNSGLRDSLLTSAGTSYNDLKPTVQEQVDERVKRIQGDLFVDFEIINITVKNEKAICEIKLNLRTFSPSSSSTIKNKVNAAQEKYMSDNYDKIKSNYVTLGEEATLNLMYNDFIVDALDIIVAGCEDESLLEKEEHTVKLQIEEIDGKYLVTAAGID